MGSNTRAFEILELADAASLIEDSAVRIRKSSSHRDGCVASCRLSATATDHLCDVSLFHTSPERDHAAFVDAHQPHIDNELASIIRQTTWILFLAFVLSFLLFLLKAHVAHPHLKILASDIHGPMRQVLWMNFRLYRKTSISRCPITENGQKN